MVYTDEILVINHGPQVVMDYMASCYMLKPGSVVELHLYLGSQISKFHMDGVKDPDKPQWAMSSELYVNQAVADVDTDLAKLDKYLPKQVTTPVAQGYRPKLDTSHELDAK
jgi:hypothetical protein